MIIYWTLKTKRISEFGDKPVEKNREEKRLEKKEKKKEPQ